MSRKLKPLITLAITMAALVYIAYRALIGLSEALEDTIWDNEE